MCGNKRSLETGGPQPCPERFNEFELPRGLEIVVYALSGGLNRNGSSERLKIQLVLLFNQFESNSCRCSLNESGSK